MTPVILELGSGGILIIGGSGGSLITSAVALVTQFSCGCILVCLVSYLFAYMILFCFVQSIINHLWLGMSLEDAINACIVFVDSKNNVNFEPGFDKVKYSYFHPHCPLMEFKFTGL